MAIGKQAVGVQTAVLPASGERRHVRTEPLYAKLQPRRNGPGPDAVASNQRARLFGAMIEEVAERSYRDATLSRLVALAGVSKRAVHEQFGTKQTYFLATYDAIAARTIERVDEAHRAAGDAPANADWQARLRCAFAAFTAEVADQPKAARLALVEALGAGPAAVARMAHTRSVFAQMLSAGLNRAPGGAPPPLIVRAIVCGTERVARRRLLAGDAAQLPVLADELLAWAVSLSSPVVARLRPGSPVALAVARTNPLRRDGPAPCQPSARAGEGDRARIVRAAARIVAARGYAQLSPAQLAHEADVSESRFYELFDSTERCFACALERSVLEALVGAVSAARAGEDRPSATHHAIAGLMRHMAANPLLPRMAFVELMALGRPGVVHREQLLERFTRELARSLGPLTAPSPLATEASVGAIWAIVEDQVKRGTTHALARLANHATYVALAPAIGGEAALAVIDSATGPPGDPAGKPRREYAL
jgi:AcrR family transcriptional regulator